MNGPQKERIPEAVERERREIAQRLRDARNYLGLKQEEVATALGIPRTALVDIESGQRRVEVTELSRLAKLYKQSVGYFIGEDTASSEQRSSVAHLARQAATLSDNDREELSRFAEFLRTRTKPE